MSTAVSPLDLARRLAERRRLNHEEVVQPPNLLLTAALHDPRVAYWEPAKLLAELRHGEQAARNSSVMLMRTDLEGAAGERFLVARRRGLRANADVTQGTTGRVTGMRGCRARRTS